MTDGWQILCQHQEINSINIYFIDGCNRSSMKLNQQKKRLPNIIEEIHFPANKIQFSLMHFIEFAYWALLRDIL